ncbi:Porin O precursor [Anatilimnocola aggregata]|uniref:Porin O n=1 Tax=Anatilimnocola aggregata TaxID=2528021 RepID=A0A517YEV8_9BACT|nr:porin [Anatilimnocola aggregata]QDU28759.1 Porin O precursor [Anatilimnocola aggregata]
MRSIHALLAVAIASSTSLLTASGQPNYPTPFPSGELPVQQYSAPQLPAQPDPTPLAAPYQAPVDAEVASELTLADSSADLAATLAPADPTATRLAALEKEMEALKAASKKLPNVTINGIVQADAVVFHQDAASRATFDPILNEPIQNGADFRRVRLSAKGAVAENMNYFVQMDFGFFGRPTFTDVWMEWTNLPILGNVRVGQWKHPFSLEVVSSFRYTTFMERSSLFQAFTPFRHIGIGFYNNSEDLNTTWAGSLFRTGQDQFGGSLSTDGGNGLAGRLTHLLWYDEPADGRYYCHIGGAYYYNSPPRDLVRFRSIPEIFVGEFAPGAVGTSGQAVPGAFNGTPFFVDTLLLDAQSVNTFGVENLTVHGAFSFQAEAMAAIVDQTAGGTATLAGMYMQAGYFLTGEHRPYDRKAGAIDRVKPFEDFFWVNTNSGRCCGLGAWEIAARWSYIDLNDGTIVGGEMSNLTTGVNWYCNPYCKVVFNFVHSWLDYRTGVQSETSAFALRAQIDF